jgi:hypothetical protein
VIQVGLRGDIDEVKKLRNHRLRRGRVLERTKLGTEKMMADLCSRTSRIWLPPGARVREALRPRWDGE